MTMDSHRLSSLARQRVRTLAVVSEQLSHLMAPEEVIRTFVAHAIETIGAKSCSIYLLPESGERRLQLAFGGGAPPGERPSTIDLNGPVLPVTVAVQSGEAVWREDSATAADGFPDLQAWQFSGALAALPLIVSGTPKGAAAFAFDCDKQWDEDEREFFTTLVAQLASSLERARLLLVERSVHETLSRRTDELRLLVDVGTLLSSSLDYEATLRQLAELLVPVMADWSAIDVLDEEGRVRRLAAFHSDPQKVEFVHAIERKYPNDPNAPHGVPNVLRTAQTEWVPQIPEELLVTAAKDEEHLKLIFSLGLRSYVCVPLKARGRILGALSLVHAESGRQYTPEDVRYVEELALRASLAIDNAKLYEEQVAARVALERQARQSLLVADIGSALNQGSVPQEALQRCTDALVARLDAGAARIWTLDAQGNTLELQASSDVVGAPRSSLRLPVGEFEVGLVARYGEPRVIDDIASAEGATDPDWAASEGLRAFAGCPLRVGGKLVGVIAVCTRGAIEDDVRRSLSAIADMIAMGIERTRAEQRAVAERDSLEVLNEVGRSLAAQLDHDKLVQSVTDYATRLSGAAFGAFFYNVVNPSGESYYLYTISGVPREAFSKFPMPRNTSVFAPTFAGEGTVRVDDIRKDPRYGHTPPYHGMPEGHLPVASYLAVPVVSRDRSVIGGLFFGHPLPGVFTERHEAMVTGVAAQAAIAMDNARLFKDAQRLIAQLDRSNKELDQFAYVASHDLKAPLRGISNLSQWIEEDLGEAVTPNARQQLALLRNRVQRMEGLINGILDYSRAGRVRGKPERVDVGGLLAECLELLAVPQTATIDVAEGMPSLVTERVPLQQVFLNLLGNGLKHAKREDPHVTVSVREAEQDFLFSISDNGPGIAPEFHDRIWGIFQTLEPRDTVEGTGVGLSIVKKIVESRGGRVELRSAEGAGAIFSFTWPRAEEATSSV